MQHYLEAFLGPPDGFAWKDPRALPLAARDVAGLPPAFITAAGHDPLHDDAVLFAERLQAAAVPVVLRRERALGHSYMRARRVSAPAGEGFAAIVTAIGALAHEGRLPEAS
jgi:acetyl esterase